MDLSADAVRTQLNRILSSPAFVDASSATLLTTAVQNALAGRAPAQSPTAEETRDLQSRLEDYYADPGKNDPVIIGVSDACVAMFRARGDAGPAGYQPSPGRKLFMFVLCLVALIALWVFYFFAAK